MHDDDHDNDVKLDSILSLGDDIFSTNNPIRIVASQSVLVSYDIYIQTEEKALVIKPGTYTCTYVK